MYPRSCRRGGAGQRERNLIGEKRWRPVAPLWLLTIAPYLNRRTGFGGCIQSYPIPLFGFPYMHGASEIEHSGVCRCRETHEGDKESEYGFSH